MFGRNITQLMGLSFVVMVISSIMGGYTDIKFHPRGYAWMLVNCLCTAGYALFMKKYIAQVEFRDFDTVFYNNILALPIFLVFSILFEDWESFLTD